MNAPLEVAFSPCPNDTFIFYAWANGLLPDAPPMVPIMADIEQLNQWALAGKTAISKVSLGCLKELEDRYELLTSGAALGEDCGPLLVADRPMLLSELAGCPVATPGAHTTANLLLQLFAPHDITPIHCLYHEIPTLIQQGECVAGVIIHETRFQYPNMGLHLVADLGSLWQTRFHVPVPLGGIVARRDIQTRNIIANAIRDSLLFAQADPEAPMEYILRHSQELDEATVRDHIRMFVNSETLHLSEKALKAINLLVNVSISV